MNNSEWLTIAEYAAEIGISVSQARRLCKMGLVDTINVGSGSRDHFRVKRGSLPRTSSFDVCLDDHTDCSPSECQSAPTNYSPWQEAILARAKRL